MYSTDFNFFSSLTIPSLSVGSINPQDTIFKFGKFNISFEKLILFEVKAFPTVNSFKFFKFFSP